MPQGSTLGLLLFANFINNLPSCVNYGYADHFKLIGTDCITIGLNLGKILKWLDNFMAINFAKTKYIQLRGTTRLKVVNFLFDSTPFMKDLDIIVSENLTWSEHAEKRVEKLKAIYAIKLNLVKATLSNKKNAYRSYIVPVLSYGSV